VLGLGALFVASYMTWLAATAISDNVLDRDYYIEAARDARVYERVYDQRVFAEQLRDSTQEITGGIEVETDDVVSVVSEIAPPEYLQVQVERAISRMVDFANGETDDLDLSLDFGEPMGRIRPVVVDYVRDRLATLPQREARTDREFARYLQQSLADLQTGKLPRQILTYRVEPADAQEAVDSVFIGGAELTPPERQELLDALADGRTDDAFVLATDVLIEPVYEAAMARLRDNIGGNGEVLDPVARQAGEESKTVEEYVAEVRDTRDTLLRIKDYGLVLAPVVMVVAAVLLMLAFFPAIRSGLLVSGAIATLSSLLVLAGCALAWVFIPGSVSALIDRQGGDGAQAFSPILADLGENLADGLIHGWIIRALVVLAVAVVIMVASRFTPAGYED